jgi:hypothetical protein
MDLLGSVAFWTAVGSIAAVIVAVSRIRRGPWRLRRPRRLRVFLSMQVSQLTPDQYDLTRSEAMGLVGVLRRTDDVYFLNEQIPRLEDFSEKSFDARSYLEEIRRADYFVAVITDKICSSIYFEAGFALALRKPSIYFVTRAEVMPALMRVLGDDHPRIKVVQAESLADITPTITKLIDYGRTHSAV